MRIMPIFRESNTYRSNLRRQFSSVSGHHILIDNLRNPDGASAESTQSFHGSTKQFTCGQNKWFGRKGAGLARLSTPNCILHNLCGIYRKPPNARTLSVPCDQRVHRSSVERSLAWMGWSRRLSKDLELKLSSYRFLSPFHIWCSYCAVDAECCCPLPLAR